MNEITAYTVPIWNALAPVGSAAWNALLAGLSANTFPYVAAVGIFFWFMPQRGWTYARSFQALGLAAGAFIIAAILRSLLVSGGL